MLPVLYPHLTWSDLFAFLNIFKQSEAPFIEGLKDKFRSRYAMTFYSGRAGLYNILKAHGIKNKSILISAYTCCVVTEAIVQSGNKPVFIDLNGESFNAKITKELISNVTDLGAIVITNLYGITQFADLEVLKGHQDVLLILDDALSPAHVASRPKDVYDYVTISCGVRKPFSCLGGGVVFTDKDANYEILSKYVKETRKQISYPEKFKKIFLSFLFFIAFQPAVYSLTCLIRYKTGLLNSFFSERYNEIHKESPEYFVDMQPFQKRIGVNQLKKIDKLWAKRREIGNLYFSGLSQEFAWIKKYWSSDTPYSHVPFLHPQRDKLQHYLLKNKIETERYFDYVIPDIETYNYKGRFPNAKTVAERIINLPINVGMNEGSVRRVVEIIKQFETENHA